MTPQDLPSCAGFRKQVREQVTPDKERSQETWYSHLQNCQHNPLQFHLHLKIPYLRFHLAHPFGQILTQDLRYPLGPLNFLLSQNARLSGPFIIQHLQYLSSFSPPLTRAERRYVLLLRALILEVETMIYLLMEQALEEHEIRQAFTDQDQSRALAMCLLKYTMERAHFAPLHQADCRREDSSHLIRFAS
jgi:hypothetical protein